jgi:hypothetical protein
MPNAVKLNHQAAARVMFLKMGVVFLPFAKGGQEGFLELLEIQSRSIGFGRRGLSLFARLLDVRL